jgi:hypothetical protein
MEADFAIVAQRNPAADAVILRRYLAWWAMRVKDHRAALRLFAGAWRRSPAALPRAVADLLVVGRDALEHRLGVTLPSAPAPPPTDAVRAWRNEGQAWVDALLGPGPPPHSGCGSAGAGGAP